MLADSEASIVIVEGQLITVDKPPTKQQYNRGQSNFWFDKQNNSIRFREGQKKDKSIQVEFQNEKYQYEGIISSNIYEIIVRTSIFSLLFGNSSRHVAVTEESLRLPFEQQPWFIGAVDKKDVKKLEQAQTRMFFTRAKGPKVYLHWTRTKSTTDTEGPILLESNDLSLVLPRGEFITARHNGGVVKHRNEVLFCRRIMENDLEGAKVMLEQGVNLKCPFLHEPNLLTYYIEHTPQRLQSDELIIWLLKLNGGVFIDYEDKALINVVASRCSDHVIEAFLEHGVPNNPSVTKRAISRKIPPHRLRIYFKTLSITCGSSKYNYSNEYLESIKDYKDGSDCTNRVLITCAWQFGNDDNLFKQLPIELLQHIISFGVDDEYPWLDYVDPPDVVQFVYQPVQVLLKLAVIVWHYRHEPNGKYNVECILDRLIDKGLSGSIYNNLTPSQMKTLVSWIITLSTLCQPKKYTLLKSGFMKYLTTNHHSVPHIKSLLDSGTFNREWWIEPGDTGAGLVPVPTPLSWSVINPEKLHKSLIALLIHENLLPEQCVLDGEILLLKEYLEMFHSDSSNVRATIAFIEECRSASKTGTSRYSKLRKR